MNILIDRLPTAVTLDGNRYQMETDYRAAVAFELLVDSGEENIYTLMRPFYPHGLPENAKEAVEAALWFYRGGEDLQESEEKPVKKLRAYSFEADASTIFADFWRYYNIDLSNESLHWWTFRALLAGLPNDSGYKERVYYRTCDLKGLPKPEQNRIKRIRNLIAIGKEKTSGMTLAERNALMLEYVAKRTHETKGG
jgi:hypothetical protein